MQSPVFLYVDMQALTFGAGLSSAAGVRTQLTALASPGEKTSMSFFRHEEIYRSDVSPGYSWERQLVAAPVLIGCDEFPVGYSLAGCPPAEPASALPTANDSKQSTLPYNHFSAYGKPKTNNNSKTKSNNKTKTKNKIKVVYTEDLTHPTLKLCSLPARLPIILKFATQVAAPEGNDGIGPAHGPEHT